MTMISSKFASRCKGCGKAIRVGETVEWIRGVRGVKCVACAEGSTPAPIADAKPAIPAKIGKLVAGSPNEPRFVIDWSDLKKSCLSALDGNITVKRAANREVFESNVISPSEGWHGYSGGQLQRWLREGYSADAIRALQEFSPPLREKKRLRYVEDGDEIHIDRIYGGDDNYMSEWTKREIIPGVSVRADISFVATTPASTVNAYNAWLCRSIYSLESIGIDCEVTLCSRSREVFREFDGWNVTEVRVKKEGETTDFQSISPMLSPAAWRSFMFAAFGIHAESKGYSIAGGYGYAERSSQWAVEYDAERRRIFIQTQYQDSSGFPEEMMTAAFRSALSEMSRSS
jgi:hypothetical protein